jgi:hypothetical protein
MERYRGLRAFSIDLNYKIILAIPRQAYDIGNTIGILRHGVLEFDSTDMTNTLMDCCRYDWFENGKNVVQRYSETYPPGPGTDESCLLIPCSHFALDRKD